jgi:ARG/rhodanese/phosphatase superfamily protein
VTADIFGSHSLFVKVWPKLLRANAVEAVAEMPKDKKFTTLDVAAARSFLKNAEQGNAVTQDVLKGIRQRTHESERAVLFETVDRRGAPYFIRCNYLAK